MKFLLKNRFGLLIPTLLLLAAGCGGGAKDPAAELAALKDERAQLDTRIAELEKQTGGAKAAAPKVRTVALTELKTETFQHFIDLQGKVEADQSVAVTSRMPGALRAVYVNNGDAVRKGQLLAKVDDAVLRSSLAEMEGQLATATDIYNRQKALWDQKIGTEVAYIQAKNGKESIERSMETMRTNLNMTNIYAPQSGTVDMVMLKVGQAIAPGVPLCNIVNLGNLKIVGQVTEAYAANVRRGDKVQVYFPDTKREVTTTVKYVSKTINPMTRTFSMECNLPNGAGDYRANQVAVLKIVDYNNPKAVVVPVNVIQSAEDGDFVLVAEKSGTNQATARKVSVQQGQNYNGRVEILNGLKAGDFIISTGFQEVNGGEVVSF